MESKMEYENEMKEIIEEFLTESRELLDNASNQILEYEKSRDNELINSIFRGIHTIKGTSSFLNFGNLSRLAHKTEDVLGKIRKGEIEPEKYIIDTLLESVDAMKLMLDEIGLSGKDEGDTDVLIKKLEEILNSERKRIGELLVEDGFLSHRELEGLLEKQKIEGHTKKLGEIVVEEGLATQRQVEKALLKQKSLKEDQTIRIDVKKLDEMMNLVGELVLGKNRLMVLNQNFRLSGISGQFADLLSEIASYIESITNELQICVMKARLVPISKVFNRIPRMVRELSNEFGKEIELRISGEETELDKSVIEVLHDPMVHIIRNSIDHGIEPPDERERKGKSRKGLLAIDARNVENHIIIEVFDDGRGIDTKALREKVLEKGLMREEEINSMTEKEIMNLIFLPGLSTAKKVTKVSGRGVGMDVVKSSIEKLNGQVYVDSEQGKWTRLTLKLPLTLAIMKSLIVKNDDEIFAIPLTSVSELVKSRPDDIRYVDKNEVMILRDNVVPILDLSRIFKKNGKNGSSGYFVVCNVDEKQIALKVDQVLGQEEVVIKPLGEFLGNISGISGATIRGDGSVTLIIDIPSLVKRFAEMTHLKR